MENPDPRGAVSSVIRILRKATRIVQLAPFAYLAFYAAYMLLGYAEGNLEMDASIKDIATFFGQSEGNVRSTINRRMIDKPKRKVMYPFLKFLKIAPIKWLK